MSQARAAFRAFLPRFNRLPQDPALASQLTIGPETSTESLLQGKAGPAPGKLSRLKFIIPEPTGYPRWFAVAGASARSHATGFMFIMVQRSAGARWREAADLYDLYSIRGLLATFRQAFLGASHPPVAAANDTTLAVPPGQLSAAYARYLNDQGRGPARREFVPGPATRGLVRLTQRIAAHAPAKGWRFTDKRAPTSLPAYGFLLANGGALVVFYVKETLTWTAISSSAVLPRRPTRGLPYAPPSEILARLRVSAVRPGLQISVTTIDENFASVATTGTNASIVINDGKLIGLTKTQPVSTAGAASSSAG